MTRDPMCWRLPVVLVVALLAAFPGAAEDVRPQQPGESSRCPVCGMLVARHADWLAQLVFTSGDALFFDGAKDLFRYLLDPERPKAETSDAEIAATFVTGYYERKPVRAREAYFVIGSDVLGPMGAELVPHPSRDAAEEFLRDHGGSAVLGFDEVTAEVLAGLH